jgi:predicted patatin/cPLA2 family phospholipase
MTVTIAAPAEHEVLRVVAERVRTDSRPGQRTDGLRVALAIEGGGMRGAITGGMALALHEQGLLPAFDHVYGASSGAITGAWLLSSTPEGLRGWTEPAFVKALIRRANALRGRPIVDVRWLVEHLYRYVFPLDFSSILANPIEYHPLATDVETGASIDLHPLIDDTQALRLAIRASAALPVLGGRRFYDAGLSESVPYHTALKQQATHILVLRSRRETDCAQPIRTAPFVARTALRRGSADLRAAYLARESRLASDDARLAAHDANPHAHPSIMSLRPDPATPLVGCVSRDDRHLATALEAGRTAVQWAFPAYSTAPLFA